MEYLSNTTLLLAVLTIFICFYAIGYANKRIALLSKKIDEFNGDYATIKVDHTRLHAELEEHKWKHFESLKQDIVILQKNLEGLSGKYEATHETVSDFQGKWARKLGDWDKKMSEFNPALPAPDPAADPMQVDAFENAIPLEQKPRRVRKGFGRR